MGIYPDKSMYIHISNDLITYSLHIDVLGVVAILEE